MSKQTTMQFTQEELSRMIAADQVSLAIGKNWSLRTQFEWDNEFEINLSDLKAFPNGYKNLDELIRDFLVDKQEWNQHFAGFIDDFGLAALIAAKDNVVSEDGDLWGEWISFTGEEADIVHIRQINIDFSDRLISIVVKR